MKPTVPVELSRPAPTLTGKAGSQWVFRNGNQAKACERTLDEPAPTIHFGAALNDVRWVHESPATTVCADPRIGHPGTKDWGNGESAFERDSVRVTLEEALLLQSFPADYPLQGSRSKKFQQVGNAVPPLLAACVLRALVKP